MASYLIVHDLVSGFPTAVSGTAWFYLPSTLTPIAIFGDSDGTATTNPVTLNSQGAATVYLSQLARIVVQDVNGATVYDGLINGDSDATTVNTSTAFTGTTQGAVNDAALAAFGGQNYQYVPSGAWVGMTPRAWMNGVVRNVMAYGSVGATAVNDGVTPADSAFDAAVADASAAGAGVVYLPAGTYLFNSAHSISHSGVVVVGAGSGATTIKNNALNGSPLTFTGANSVGVRGVTITSTSPSTGSAVTIGTGQVFDLWDVSVDSFKYPLTINNFTTINIAGNCSLIASGAAGARGIKATAATAMTIVGGFVTGNEYALELLTSSGSLTCLGPSFGSPSTAAVRFDAALSGSDFRFVAIRGGATPFSFGAAAEPPGFSQCADALDADGLSFATGTTTVPTRNNGGAECVLNASSGGVGTVTVSAPTPTTAIDGTRFTIRFINGAAGAVTWTLNAVYKVTGAIPTTDAHTIIVVFEWDNAAAKWREVSRSDTTT